MKKMSVPIESLIMRYVKTVAWSGNRTSGRSMATTQVTASSFPASIQTDLPEESTQRSNKPCHYISRSWHHML